MVTGVGEGVGVGVGEGVGAGTGVGVGDGVGTGVGVGLEGALLPLVAALEELPPPHPMDTNNMHVRTANPRYLNIRAASFRVRELEMQQSSCRMVSDRLPDLPLRSRGAQARPRVSRYKGRGYTAQCTISPLTHGF